MNRALTQRQGAILTCIRESVQTRGYPPTMREIGEAVGLDGAASVKRHLDLLTERGYISRVPGSPRAITVLEPPALTVADESESVGEADALA